MSEYSDILIIYMLHTAKELQYTFGTLLTIPANRLETYCTLVTIPDNRLKAHAL